MRGPECLSNAAATCIDLINVSAVVKGYYCSNDLCIKCPIGTFGIDGKSCYPCPFATWQPEVGQSECASFFKYESAGTVKSYIPYGVTQIVVKLWGGGGGSDSSTDLTFVSHSGGSGGFSSCNVAVPHSNPVYIIVAGGGDANSLVSNAGGMFAIQHCYLYPPYMI